MKNKRRLLIFFIVVCVCAVALTFRIGQYQILQSEELSKMALEQQTQDIPLAASRGVIYDCNGVELAISAPTNTIWVRPGEVKAADTEEESQYKIATTAQSLSDLLGMSYEDVYAVLTRERALVRLAKYVDKDTADAIREASLPGISIADDVKRYYPLGAFASHILGSTTDDNQGLAGIEARYDKYLSGTAGRWIKQADVTGDRLYFGQEKYYEAENGLNEVLTIDSVIQHYLEKSIQNVQESTQAKRVMCIVMDPKTGDVLAMGMTPDYDPNDPRTPLDPEEAEYVKSLSSEDQLTYWNEKMWRNPMVSDVYEPGSTFKLLTTAIALEEGVTSMSEKFKCTGYYTIARQTLKCWRYYNPHGEETMVQAVENSCNPVFIQLSQRLGVETMYNYFDLFGLTEKTGIDYPGEGGNLLINQANVGPVELATIAYGQGIAVTPISMLTAVCSFGNDGMLMQPRLVKALTDENGDIVQTFEPVQVRQVVSSQTAADIRTIMESVVSEGGGGTAKIAGYHVGGKTGTANKVVNGTYSDEAVYSSFVGMAPMDDPQVAVLMVVDEPQGVQYGSQTAAPGVKTILEETLLYMNIPPSYSEEEKKALEDTMTEVPDVTGENFSDAIGILGGKNLTYTVSPALTDVNEDFVVVDQYPKAGEKVQKDSTVYLYRE
ncbi:MAG: PASTA domain-containing protein [Firmicutes bacterium]|nr:PASTA domain-containing protein [Bacillota bacterium]